MSWPAAELITTISSRAEPIPVMIQGRLVGISHEK